jgi:hypothetical protein
MSEPRRRSGRGGEEKNPQPLPGLEHPILQPVVQRYTTELTRILEHCGMRMMMSFHYAQLKIAYQTLPDRCATLVQLAR